MDFVEAVLADEVRVSCGPALRRALLAMGAQAGRESASLRFATKAQLSALLTQLQQLGVPFGDAPSGWPPAAVFAQLRDEGWVQGPILAVSWQGPDRPALREG